MKRIKSTFVFMSIIIIMISSLTIIDPIQIKCSITRDYWPTNGWLTKNPDEVNISSDKLADVQKYITENAIALDSLLIVREGYLVSETYYGNYTRYTTHTMFSVTKSIISALTGIAIAEGNLTLNDQMVDFFSNYTIENLDTNKEVITIEHLLSMTSGMDWIEPIDNAYMTTSENPLQYVLDRPISETPGTKFNYNSGAVNVLSAIIENATGMSTKDYAQEKLFTPLGIFNYTWNQDPQGRYFGGYGLSMQPIDMAKFGFLYLNNGTWDGEEILPKTWVEASHEKQIQVNANINYGYLFWLYPDLDYYMAQGFLGQEIMIYPRYDLIIVTTAVQSEGTIFDLFENHILPCLNDFPATTLETHIKLIPLIINSIICLNIIVITKKKKK